MRKETRNVALAFRANASFRGARSEAKGQYVLLHENVIVRRVNGSLYEYTMAGWPTITTRDRLNGVANVLDHPLRFYQKKGQQYVWRSTWDEAVPIEADDIVRYNSATHFFEVEKRYGS